MVDLQPDYSSVVQSLFGEPPAKNSDDDLTFYTQVFWEQKAAAFLATAVVGPARETCVTHIHMLTFSDSFASWQFRSIFRWKAVN